MRRYCLMFFTLMGAAGCAVFGIQEYRLADRSSREPEEISLRDLIERGPDGNPNIILKDFSIVEDYVYQKKMLSGKWTKVWVPIIPSGAEEADAHKPAAIHAFIFSEDVGNETELRQRFDRPRLRGLINRDAPKPGIIGNVLLNRRFPGTNPSNCLILEEGKEPAGVLKLILFCVGFVLLVSLAGGIWYLARLFDRIETEPERSGKHGKRSGSKRSEEPGPILDVLPVDKPDSQVRKRKS